MSSREDSLNTDGAIVGLAGLAVLGTLGVGALVSSYFNRPKCPYCKKRRKHPIVSKTPIKEANATVQKTEEAEVKDKDGKTVNTETRCYTVPGIKTTYDVVYQCKCCGKEFHKEETDEIEVVNHRFVNQRN